MGRRETHGKYNKNGHEGKAHYVRTLRVEDLLLDGAGLKADAPLLTLTVRGMQRGMVQMHAQDGTVYQCAKESAAGALYDDVVLAECLGGDRVRVQKVEKRAHEIIFGVLEVNKYGAFILPLERHLPQSILVTGSLCGAAEGDIVRTRVVRWPGRRDMAVEIEECAGSFERAADALTALVRSMRLPETFSPEAMAQADACRPADAQQASGRMDLRGLLTFTIDGMDARDFDDAVSIEMLEEGRVRLGVHIADVGHYVPQGSALDKEAYRRGTSVYLPGRVLPMLPEQLSNGVCSLRPGEDKYTLSCLAVLDAEAHVESMQLAATLIRSRARLVYDDVNRLFEGDSAQREAYEALAPGLPAALDAMRALAACIRKARQAKGAIDFETSEPRFMLDAQGEPVEIIKRARGEAEMMIEDFMLTANGLVAAYARENGLPALYRVHEQPDPQKLAAFAGFLSVIGVTGCRVPANAQPGQIRTVLESTRERPEFSVISALALRSMQKARYDTKPLGHYGLAMEDYCHFTSPIRRYPDLVISRALGARIHGGQMMKGDALAEAAIHSSDRERVAVEAERAADRMMMARLMAHHVGEVFDGVISGVTDFGVYVELENGAEGFLHVRTLDDWFDYDEQRMTLRGERTGAALALGQALRVRVADVQLAQSAVDLELALPIRPGRREKSARKQERARIRSFLK